MSHQFHPTVLREYDIRGVIGETLGTADAYAIGRGFATLLRQAGGTKVAVGYDGRISSPELEQALVAGLNASGVDVVRIGMGPTPMLYYAEASAKDVHGGIQITGSHNPANYNGFKMVFQGRPFFGADILELGRLAASGAWLDGDGGYERREVLTPYVARLVEGLAGIDRAQLSRLRIGWDAGNGAPAPHLNGWSNSFLANIIFSSPKLTGTSRTITRIPPKRRTWPTCESSSRKRTSISASLSMAMAIALVRLTARGG